MNRLSTTPVAIITGGSVNIGRATAILLAERGWKVFATTRRREAMSAMASANIVPLQLDVADEASMAAGVEYVLAQTGRIDALVNSAGCVEVGPLEQVTRDELQQQFETSAFGPVRMAQLVLPTMRAQGGGRIVNITSLNGRIAIPFIGLYVGSKYALEAMSDVLRMETRPFGIRVIVIEPGVTGKNFNPAAVQRVRQLAADQTSPYQRFFEGFARFVGQPNSHSSPPERVAKVIYHALTAKHPRARYIATPDAHLMLAILPRLSDSLRDGLWSRLLGLREVKTSLPERTAEQSDQRS